jgi:hypothetical protein
MWKLLLRIEVLFGWSSVSTFVSFKCEDYFVLERRKYKEVGEYFITRNLIIFTLTKLTS